MGKNLKIDIEAEGFTVDGPEVAKGIVFDDLVLSAPNYSALSLIDPIDFAGVYDPWSDYSDDDLLDYADYFNDERLNVLDN